MSKQVFLAADLGASSGRVVAGLFDGARLTLEEGHRFDNGPVGVGSRIYWDLLGLWSEVCRGLRAAAARYSGSVRSVGVDTWGVDFGLLGRGDELLGNPRHYRDRRTEGLLEKAFSVVSREEIFAQTGLQFMQFNTLYQLWAMKLERSPLLDAAQTFLMMPDLFHWLLTGVKAIEITNASTTQFYDPTTGGWAADLLGKFDLPSGILGNLVPPGMRLGPILPQVAAETNLSGVEVVAPGTHDTASAVAAVPALSREGQRPDWCYISSGTWSLMGVESPMPVINDLCRQLNFTNEGGICGTTRLLKNIGGLWLLQECRRIWAQGGREYSWDDLNRLSDAAPPHAAFVHPDDPSFMAPGDMPAAIREFCARSGQPVPPDEGAVVRCALESLALRYRQVLGWLEELVGGRIETIHIVGGGTRNRRLCQATADACNRRVLAGPVEATAIGNVMVQAMASGAVGSLAEAREVVRRSFDVEEYVSAGTDGWNEAYRRYLAATRQ